MDTRNLYEPIARDAARAYNVNECIIVEMITQESTWNPAAVNGMHFGLAQINPSFHDVNPNDPIASLWYLAKLMRSYLDKYNGRYDLSLAAYNWGGTNLDANNWIIPPSVHYSYVNPIMTKASMCAISTPTATMTATETVIPTSTPTPPISLMATPTPYPYEGLGSSTPTDYATPMFMLLPLLWAVIRRQ